MRAGLKRIWCNTNEMTRGKDRTKKRKVKRTRNTKDRRRGGQDRSKIGSMESI